MIPVLLQQPSLSWHNGDANLIDLLVVYPSAVTTAAGSTSAIQADILASVADTNLCYRNSNVNVQLPLGSYGGDCIYSIWDNEHGP